MRLLPTRRSRCAALVSAVAAVSLLTVPGSASAALAPVVTTFDSPGNHSFTVPDGVSRIHVVAVGGGGGGGGGGGNNGGVLSGAGGGGGGGGAGASCVATVKGGDKLKIVVGQGGWGGPGGEGKYDNGGPGNNGTDSGVAVDQSWPELVAIARHGGHGQGGEASGHWQSGNGGHPGAGGSGPRSVCHGTDRVLTSGQDGRRGQHGYRNKPGRGGTGGSVPVHYCSYLAGQGGEGGNGAGNNYAGDGQQSSSSAGRAGGNGCVALTYTTSR